MRGGRVATKVVALALLGAACSGSPSTEGVGPTTAPADPAALYADFAECDPLPSEGGVEGPIDGMVPLDGAWIEDVSETGPLVSIRGLVDMTPIDVRDALVNREDVELVYIEDEGYEAELLVDTGGSRTFVKATIRCRTGSVFAQIIGPADDPALLPVPGGAS